MIDQEKEEVIKALLSSLRLSPPGGRWEFLWNSRGQFPPTSGFGFTFFTDFERELVASVKAIKCYPAQLKGYSIRSVASLLKKYFESVISDIGVDTLFFCKDRDKSVRDLVDGSVFATLIKKLDAFIDARTRPSVYLTALTGFPCPTALITNSISWVGADADLSTILGPYGVHPSAVRNGHFPPFTSFVSRCRQLTSSDSWFLCCTTSDVEAESTFKRMAGALSAVLEYPASRLITGRQMIGGRASFGNDGFCHFSPKPAVVPAVATPVRITEEMIRVFKSLLVDKSNENRIQISLEYLADAWANTTRLSWSRPCRPRRATSA